MKIFLSLTLSALFGLVSYRVKWLSLSGSIAASLFGASLLFFGGIVWIGPVFLFFGSSSILSKIRLPKIERKDNNRKEDIRNAGQVLANGGIAWALLLINAVRPDEIWFVGFAGALAAATADTWGTEIGRLTKGETRSIISGKKVPQGVSGGVSWQGTLGGGLGATLIAGLAAYSLGFASNIFIFIISAGIVGSLVDSVLGATLQVKYINVASGLISEHVELSGLEYLHYSGLPWMTNDVVNFLCTAVGALFALILMG